MDRRGLFRVQDVIKIALLFGVISIAFFGFYTTFAGEYNVTIEDAGAMQSSLDNVEEIHDDIQEIQEKFADSEGPLEKAFYIIVDGVMTVLKLVFTSSLLLLSMVASIFTEFDLGPYGLGITAMILVSVVFVLWSAIYKWRL